MEKKEVQIHECCIDKKCHIGIINTRCDGGWLTRVLRNWWFYRCPRFCFYGDNNFRLRVSMFLMAVTVYREI